MPPYNDEQIIAGQGTVGLEILEDCPDVDLVLVPSGGGGLISGISAALKLSGSQAKIIGVEPELANDAQQSFRKGEIVELPAERVSSTLADGLRTQSIGPINFEHIRRFVDDMITVTEDEIRSAMRRMVTNARIVAEPSGAVTFAAWLFHAKELPEVEEDGRSGQRRQRRSAIAGTGAERAGREVVRNSIVFHGEPRASKLCCFRRSCSAMLRHFCRIRCVTNGVVGGVHSYQCVGPQGRQHARHRFASVQ